MEYILYKGQVNETYELLSNGYIYYVPISMSTRKAHKVIAHLERKERIWNWINENNGKIAIGMVLILFPLLVWLGM
jgi:hypothetical protein